MVHAEAERVRVSTEVNRENKNSSLPPTVAPVQSEESQRSFCTQGFFRWPVSPEFSLSLSYRKTMKNHLVSIMIISALIVSIVVIRPTQAQNASSRSSDKSEAMMATSSETKSDNSESSPAFVTEIPQGYRDWRLIAVSRLTSAKGSQLRAESGNDIAIKAYREGKLPFPEGAIIAAHHWKEVSSEENNQVLAKGFPGAGIQSFVPGTGVNMQFMVKDSKKYAATGGWGFGDFTNGKPGNPKLMHTCFGCHEPARDHDFVFTRYVP